MAERDRRGVAQLFGPGDRLGDHAVVGNDTIGQVPFEALAPPARARRVDRELERTAMPDALGQQPRHAAVGHQADLRERHLEKSVLAHHDEIADQRERAADAGGEAVHRGDDWFRHRRDRAQRRTVFLVELALDFRAGRHRLGLEVGTRAEAATRARQHDGAHGRDRRRRPAALSSRHCAGRS